jgi:hypothetical protein
LAVHTEDLADGPYGTGAAPVTPKPTTRWDAHRPPSALLLLLLLLLLAQVGPVEVDLDGTTGLLPAGDLEPVPAAEPRAGLLPALDPTVMGWSERGWFLDGHGPALFDRSGNAGPTVWWDGRVVGGWAQRRDGEIAFRLLEDVGADAAVEAAAERLHAWLGPVRVTPRFRTPLERELCA